MMILRKIAATLCLLLLFSIANANTAKPSWAVMGGYSRTVHNTFGAVLGGNAELAEESLYSVEVGYRLSDTNPLVKFLSPIMTYVEPTLNFTYRDDPAGPIYEINPYLSFRWANFPWDKYLHTRRYLCFEEHVTLTENNCSTSRMCFLSATNKITWSSDSMTVS